jgi:hypothetical protein
LKPIVKDIVKNRWEYAHSDIHSAGFCLDLEIVAHQPKSGGSSPSRVKLCQVVRKTEYAYGPSYYAFCPGIPEVHINPMAASAGGCERNWSTYDFITNRKRNKLDPRRAEDLVYVHYNKRCALKSRMPE